MLSALQCHRQLRAEGSECAVHWLTRTFASICATSVCAVYYRYKTEMEHVAGPRSKGLYIQRVSHMPSFMTLAVV
jgi:hypothetical protein